MMGENKPVHEVVIIYRDMSQTVVKRTTKMWKALKASGELKYSDYPEGTVFVIRSNPPKKEKSLSG